ncbi:hypothetical protein GCM10028825_06220 [Spirosoma agri]
MINIVIFVVSILVISWILAILFNPEWKFLVPFFFIPAIVRPLFRTKVYGKKKVYSTKQDGRYKSGSRVTGSSYVKDKSAVYELEPNELAIGRGEGFVKLLIFGWLLYSAYPQFKADSTKYSFVRPPFQIKNLTIGMPISSLKKVEKHKPDLTTDWRITYPKSMYAGEIGEMAYGIKEGSIDEIEFSKQGDMEAYSRLLKLLNAKYGPTRDSSESASTWENDSLRFSIRKSGADVTVELKPNPYYTKKR